MSTLFYKPEDGWAADFIPLFWDGKYHLFYLKDYRDDAKYGPGTPWFQLVTDDFVNFEDWGEAIPRGPAEAQDLWIFTGSAIAHDGLFSIFYTGHNRLLRAKGEPQEAVMRAVSRDLRTWEKDPDFAFFAPPGYEPHDWRDPFVFWNAEAGEYWMLLAARATTGPSRNRGVTALATSPDLQTWTVRDPFWAPDLYFTHECPDLFRMGEWWYLIFSEFSDRHLTRYRMSRSLQGPWLAPPDDSFDARTLYAAKTASDGKRRLLFGWNPTRVDESDTGRWQWGGNLIVHELTQAADGTLRVKPPAELIAAVAQAQPTTPQPRLGEWTTSPDELQGTAQAGFAWCNLGALPSSGRISATINFAANTQSFGFILRADAELDHYYQVRFEPAWGRVVVDRWPRPGDEPPMVERPLVLSADDPIRVQIFVDGTIVEIYVNDQIALSARGYEQRTGDWGLFVVQGQASFGELGLFTPNQ